MTFWSIRWVAMFAQTHSPCPALPLPAFSLCALATFAALPWPKACCVTTSKPRASESRSTQRAPTDTTTASPRFRAQTEMRRHGIETARVAANQAKDLRSTTHFVMTPAPPRRRGLAGDRADWQAKVHMFLEEGNVPDPYYGGDSGFAHVYNLVDRAADSWTDRWRGDSGHQQEAPQPPSKTKRSETVT